MVNRSIVLDTYRENISVNLAYIRYLTRDIGFLKTLAEESQDDEIKLILGQLIAHETQLIDSVRREIENDRAVVEKLSRV